MRDKSCCSSGSCSWTLTLFSPFSSSFMTHENVIPSHWGTSTPPPTPQGSGRGHMHINICITVITRTSPLSQTFLLVTGQGWVHLIKHANSEVNALPHSLSHPPNIDSHNHHAAPPMLVCLFFNKLHIACTCPYNWLYSEYTCVIGPVWGIWCHLSVGMQTTTTPCFSRQECQQNQGGCWRKNQFPVKRFVVVGNYREK